MRLHLSRHKDLAEAKAHAKAEIDAAAERARAIPPGLALEHELAYKEALEFQASPPVLGGPAEKRAPALEAEVAAGVAVDKAAAAARVISAREAEDARLLAIRSARLIGKANVDRAKTVPAALTAMRAAIAELEPPEETAPPGNVVVSPHEPDPD